jgi:hypothetical protein
MAQYGLGQSNPVEDVFSDVANESSSLLSLGARNSVNNTYGNNTPDTRYITTLSQPTITEVRNNVYYCESVITQLLKEIESNLDQVNINAYCNIDLENSHKAVWQDALKHNEKASLLSFPNFIPYTEYQFASKHLCRSCRELIKQYDLTINYTSFGHLAETKKILSYLRNEILTIKNIVTHQFGEEYRDETEGEIARHLSDWAKTALHYTKQLAKEITDPPTSIPQSELDQISKKQAAQFQAFFSIKINSYTSEIQSLSNGLKRDTVDTCSVFYSNYLLPALSFKSKVVEPLMLDFTTTSIGNECPTLLGEIIVARNSITGNLGSVTSDYVERRVQMSKKVDALSQMIRLKRRYVNYITQLESLAAQRIKVLITVETEELEKYKQIFFDIPVDSEKRMDLRSSHADLDGLDGDAHPQYLRRDGGIITGDIDVADGVKIGGIVVSNHSHSGIDGSMPISASVIDYASARNDYYNAALTSPYSNLTLTNLTQSILTGGGVIFDATFEVEIEDDKLNSYEFEILYNEV